MIDSPARFENARIALARFLYLGPTRLLTRPLGIKVAPKNHPWRILAESAFYRLSVVTKTGLRPREAQTAGAARRKTLLTRLAAAPLSIVTYVVTDAAIVGDGIGPKLQFLASWIG